MLNVEQVIREVSGVYEALTGKPIGQARTDLPPEVDPSGHVETRYREFKTLVSAMGRTSQPQAQPTAAPSFAPAMDVIELEREVRCELDLPGVTRDRVSVSVVGEYVVIRGERADARAHGGVVRVSERRTGAFQKVLALPPKARRDGIEASCREGVLTVVIPTDATVGTTREIHVDIKHV
jgi:HSP20 family protein